MKLTKLIINPDVKSGPRPKSVGVNKKIMKKYLSLIVLFGMLAIPAISFGQVYSSTVSKVVNPVIKKYTPPVTTTAKASEPASALKKNSKYDPLVALLQAKLTNLGTDPGPVDGINGTKTVNALKEVQRFFGMKPDGIYGKESQKLFSILPLNSSLRTTDPVVAIALKKYVKAEFASSTKTTGSTSNTTNSTKLATIPFTPKGISQVLSKSLSLSGLTQTSDVTISGTRLTAKPKLLAGGTRMSLYSVLASNNLNVGSAGQANLNTNFSSGTNKATAVYVCGSINNTSVCVPVSFEVAEAINKGTMTLEQYLASKSANGGICVQCFLDDNGDLGVITGGETTGPIIPAGPNVVNAANVVSMCVDYPARGTGNVVYEVTFDKPVNVMYSSGLKLEVVRYYNAPSKKVVATYAGAPDGTIAGKTIRFHAPAGQLSSIYYEGEGTLKSSAGAKIVVSGTGETVDLSLLTDIFRFSNTCTNAGSSYDVVDTSVELSPDKLYGGESFDAPRLNVSLKFNEAVTPTSGLKLLMNPSDTGGTAVGKLVSSTSGSSDTLTFHFNLSTGSGWSSILGNFGFDPSSGSIKGASGKTMLMNMPSGADSTGGTCAMKYIGQPCLDLVDGKAKYTVYYTRKLDVTNAGNNSIRLKIEPLNPSAPDVIANLTNYDAHHLYFETSATTNLVSDYTGHYWLQVDPPSRVFTINGTLDSLGLYGGGDADPDMGVSGATCSGDGGGSDTTITDSCMDFRVNAENIATLGTGHYRIVFNETVEVSGIPELWIQKDATAPIVKALFTGYKGADHKTIEFTAQINSGLNAGVDSPFYVGTGTIHLVNNSTIKNATGENATLTPVSFSGTDLCPPAPIGMCIDYNIGLGVNYRLTFEDPVTITGNDSDIRVQITKANGTVIYGNFTGQHDGGKVLSFLLAPGTPMTGSANDFVGQASLILSNGATITYANGTWVNTNLGMLLTSSQCTAPEYQGLATLDSVLVKEVTEVSSTGGYNNGPKKKLHIEFKFKSSQNGNPNAYVFGTPAVYLQKDHTSEYGARATYVEGSGTDTLTFEHESNAQGYAADKYDLTVYNKLHMDITPGSSINTLAQDNMTYWPSNLSALDND